MEASLRTLGILTSEVTLSRPEILGRKLGGKLLEHGEYEVLHLKERKTIPWKFLGFLWNLSVSRIRLDHVMLFGKGPTTNRDWPWQLTSHQPELRSNIEDMDSSVRLRMYEKLFSWFSCSYFPTVQSPQLPTYSRGKHLAFSKILFHWACFMRSELQWMISHCLLSVFCRAVCLFLTRPI